MLFITCAETLEPVLTEELKELGIEEVTPGFRGVYVPFTMKAIYTINYRSRIAGRVLLPIAKFACRNKEALYKEAMNINWLDYLTKDKTFAIDFSGIHPAFRNTLYAAQVVKDAICDHFREKIDVRPNVNVQSPDVQIHLFLQNGSAQISIDTSGEPLFKRGYRREGGSAPMQESLAAALLRIAKYTGEEVLLDPCCGSGTILIEAALAASKTPPGYLRRKWGFFHLPEFSQAEWDSVRKEADSEKINLAPGKIYGLDIHRDAIRVANANIRSAGFHDQIKIACADFRSASLDIQPNLVICNPPHGIRLGDIESLTPLYRELGDFLKQKLAKPAKAFVFTQSLDLAKEVGLKPKQRHVISSSGIDSRLLEYDLY